MDVQVDVVANRALAAPAAILAGGIGDDDVRLLHIGRHELLDQG